MDTDKGPTTAPAYPAMRELLRQCVAETEADVVFVALQDIADTRKGAKLAIPAMFPVSQHSAQHITRWARSGVCEAIEGRHTQVTVGRVSGRGVRAPKTRLLIAAPMYTTSGKAWGAVALVKESSVINSDVITSLERCARTITHMLTQSDDSIVRPEQAVPPPPHSRPKVHSGPRDDFLLHELRVPLSAAAFALDALLQRHGPNWQPDDERLLHTARSGVSESQRVVRMASQWPALGDGKTMPVFEAISISEVVEHTLTLLPAARYRVVQRLDQHLPPVHGNENWITHVLMNLLENALKYASTRQPIEVTAHHIDSDYILVGVRSWGEGASPDRIGTPDDPTSKGLGLNIARYFVTSMSGEIWTEDDGTGGFTVMMALPAASAVTLRVASEVPI